MSNLKTKENDGDVEHFLKTVPHARRRADSLAMLARMTAITAEVPRMWGNSIVGFGAYDYQQKNGTPGRWFLTGFSPRKAALTVYIMPGFSAYEDLLARLGPHRHSVSCLYLPRLDAVDGDVLAEMIAKSVDEMRTRYHA